MRVLTETETAALVNEDVALDAAREAFFASANGVLFPVVFGHGAEAGTRFSLKSASSGDLVGVKIGSYWPGNDAHGISRHGTSIVLLDPGTGRVAAVVEAAQANAYRTAAADALAVQTLAPPDARVVALFGTGHQALYEARAVARVRPVERVLVVGRRMGAAAAFRSRLEAQLGLPVEIATAEQALALADIVVTVTTAREPLFEAEWVRPGTHLSAMGADVPGKHELPAGLYEHARLFCDVETQSRTMGEFQHAPPDTVLTPLGAVLTGDAPGRGTPEEITIFDSSGFALQDLTIAAALLRAHSDGP